MLPTIMAEIFKNNRQEEKRELDREKQEIERWMLPTIIAEIFKNNRQEETKELDREKQAIER